MQAGDRDDHILRWRLIESAFESEIFFRKGILAQRQEREAKNSTEITNETTTHVTKC